MLKNYLKVAWRNLVRQPGYSFINITGLALGLTCSMLILLWVQDELSFDGFHKNARSLYRVLIQYPDESGDGIITLPKLPSPLAKAAKEEIPEVINVARLQPWGGKRELIKYQGKVFYEQGITSYDKSFLEMFDFPLVKGTISEILQDKNDVVITEATARKYFGDEDPIGKGLNWNNWQTYTVKGVLKDIPQNSHIQFSLLTSFENEERAWPQGFSWFMFNKPIYMQVRQGADVEEVNRKLTQLLKMNNPRTDDPDVKVFLQPLTDIHLTTDLAAEYAIIRDAKYVYGYSIIALLILGIACINFVNLSTARSARRAREVGLRKTIGADRLRIFGQHISESFLLIAISQMFALVLVAFFLPVFNELSGKALSYDLFDPGILFGAIAFILVIGILAGSYPALYLSGFDPIRILKGATRPEGERAALRKGLVVIQFSFSIALILGTIIVSQQLHFLKNKKLGFEKENIVYLPTKDNVGKNYFSFKNRLLQDSNILGVTIKDIFPSGNLSEARLAKRGADPETGPVASVAGVGYQYFKTLNLEIVEGRTFSREFTSDTVDAAIINREAARRLGFESAVGEKLKIGRQEVTVIGVVEDAHFRSLHHKIEPQIYYKLTDFTSNGMNLYGVILVKINGKNLTDAVATIQSAWDDVNPAFPLEVNFVDEKYNQLYKSEQQVGTIVNYFTFLAILISCLGLFGLASFTAEQRTKEIGVRKVLGASISGIVLMLSGTFTKWVIIANIIAWPIAYFVMKSWLRDFAYKIEIEWWVFALAGGSALLIAILTVSAQAIRAALANPVKALRYE